MATQRRTARVEQTQSFTEEIASPSPVIREKKITPRKKQEVAKDKAYSVIKGGGIWYKIRQEGITYFDKELGYPREIRYAPNQKSAFVDEQEGQVIREQVVFENGLILVPYTKPNLAMFLDLHPDNIANGGNVFKLVDTTIEAASEVDKEFLLFDAIKLIKEKSIEELMPVAMSLGIKTDQSNMEIKRELLRDAKRNPQKFINMFDNPVVQVKSNIIMALDFQIIKKKVDGMYWFDNDRIICATPVGKDTVDVFTSFCMTADGTPSYEEIKRQLESFA